MTVSAVPRVPPVRKLIAGLAVLIILLGGLSAYRNVMAARGDPDLIDRFRFRQSVKTQLLRAGASYPAIIGDSISALAPPHAHKARCGGPVVVAALSGAQLRHALDDILPLLRPKPPARIVIAIGVNESKRLITMPRAERLAQFAANYRSLLTQARTLTPAVAVVLISPVAESGPLGSDALEPALIAEFNQIIEAAAHEADVPAFPLAALAGPNGLARAGLTTDGVHLSDAGYAIWTDTVDKAWSSINRCKS